VLPGTARILGDCRSFSPRVSQAVEEAIRRIAEGVAVAHGCRAEVGYSRQFVPLVNDAHAARAAVEAARTVFGDGAVDPDCPPITASEDFARFLEHVPGCYVLLGNGTDSLPLHNAGFDFNDGALECGARFLVELTRRRLGATRASQRTIT
jgi:hippurate hydrolase